jgi:chitin disaccharide deacetylase
MEVAMSRELIVNADDFGRTRGVSAGILQAHRDGIVTSITAMMNLPGVVNDLHKARAEAPRLALGVHLNFTVGRPLLPTEWCSSLVDEHGRFLTREALMAQPDRINPDELRAELKSQITAFKNALEQLPDHLDAHQLAHLYPPLFRVYIDLAESFKLPLRIPFPQLMAELDQAPAIIGDVPLETAQSMLHADRQFLVERDFKTTDHFVGTFYDRQATVEHLLSVIENLPKGTTELMTHPGLADDQLKSGSSYTVQREQEVAVLTDPRVKARLAELDIRLVTFAEL